MFWEYPLPFISHLGEGSRLNQTFSLHFFPVDYLHIVPILYRAPGYRFHEGKAFLVSNLNTNCRLTVPNLLSNLPAHVFPPECT